MDNVRRNYTSTVSSSPRFPRFSLRIKGLPDCFLTFHENLDVLDYPKLVILFPDLNRLAP